MLIGEFRCSTDSDGRLMLPVPFRADLTGGATVTRGIERCLWIYPVAEWEELAEKLHQLPFTSQAARRFSRFMFSAAAVCTPDQAGQLLLPEQLRQYAGIDDEAVVVGLLSHLEIWHPADWQERTSLFAEEGPALAEAVRQFGI